MRYRTLGNSGCAVSELCLGTMTFGNETDEAGAHAQLDRFVEAGGTLVDTADVYSAGVSEEIIGRWLAARPAEVTEPSYSPPRDGSRWPADPNGAGLSARHLTRALEASLGRLGVDSVDLYQVHAWDPWTPIEETLRTLDGFVRSGRIRYYGFSNFTGWQLTKAVHTARALGPGRAGDPPAAVQPDRAGDRVGDRPRCPGLRSGPAPLEPAGWRLAEWQVPARPAPDRRDPPRRGPRARHGGLGRRGTERTWQIIEAVQQVGREARGHDGAGRPLLGHQPPGVTSTILGARTLEQLEDNLGSVEVALSAEESACSRRPATCTPATTPTAPWGSTQRDRAL